MSWKFSKLLYKKNNLKKEYVSKIRKKYKRTLIKFNLWIIILSHFKNSLVKYKNSNAQNSYQKKLKFNNMFFPKVQVSISDWENPLISLRLFLKVILSFYLLEKRTSYQLSFKLYDSNIFSLKYDFAFSYRPVPKKLCHLWKDYFLTWSKYYRFLLREAFCEEGMF